jgi:hypothetical protein
MYVFLYLLVHIIYFITRERIVVAKEFDLQILLNLHAFSYSEYEKVACGMPSLHLCVRLSENR